MIIGNNDEYTAPHNYRHHRPPSRLGGVLTYIFFLIRIVGGGVQTGSTRHVGH
jgi:hypothetical protein